jgi:GNAT superfamily N-acetyltransferase
MKLVAATGEQKRARDRQAHAAWGAHLSIDGYVEREERLRTHPWARQAMDTWFLLGDDGALLSSCETYRVDGWRRGVRSEVWAVASVFTEELLRGRGHATVMLDRLLERARAAGVLASILYSDVGARQYERNGYRPRPAEDLLFTPLTGDAADGVDVLVADADSASASPAAPSQDFVVWPTAAQLDWHVERTRSYAALLARPSLPWVGARAGSGEIRWMVDWKSDSLKVLLMAAARADEAAALVRAAQRTAMTLALREVRLWAQPWPFDAERALGGTRVTRPDSLPMLAPLDPSLTADAWRHIPRAVWV